MKNIITYLLPLLLLCGCSDSDSDKPVIKIVGVYIEGDEDEVNYAKSFTRMPLLEKGDKVDIHLVLSGNAEDLRTFAVTSTEEKVKVDIIDYEENVISPDLSEPDDGKLVFVDGVDFATIVTKAIIIIDENGEQTVSFYLFSKALESEGAHVDLILKTQQQEK